MDRFNTLTSQRSSTYSVGSADTLTEHDRANSTTLLEAFAEVRHLYISHQPFFFSSLSFFCGLLRVTPSLASLVYLEISD